MSSRGFPVIFWTADGKEELFTMLLEHVPRIGERVHVWRDTIAGGEPEPARDFVVRGVRHDICSRYSSARGATDYKHLVELFVEPIVTVEPWPAGAVTKVRGERR